MHKWPKLTDLHSFSHEIEKQTTPFWGADHFAESVTGFNYNRKKHPKTTTKNIKQNKIEKEYQSK